MCTENIKYVDSSYTSKHHITHVVYFSDGTSLEIKRRASFIARLFYDDKIVLQHYQIVDVYNYLIFGSI